jgi:two-component system, chemotaxis family, response regulator PixG
MKTLPISRYRFFQKIQPLTLLSKITSKPVTGCLHVFTVTGSWSIYLDEGKLIYACCSDTMFELLYKKLHRLSQQIPNLHSGINQQLQAIFETGIENQAIPNPDYLAICWLVNQKYINRTQAGVLIEELTIDVLESFLRIEEGSYEFTPESFLDDMPKFCHLDMRLLLEQCQKRYLTTSHSVSARNSAQIQTSQQPSIQPSVSDALRSQFHSKNQPQAQTKTQQPFSRQNGNKPTENSHRIPPRDAHVADKSRQQSSVPPVEKKLYTIVCIDDSPAILSAIKNFLDEQIFSVVGINDPLKALMQILRTKPDIILLDIQMPDLDGYELCSLLRRHSHFQNTPVIMVTGKTGFIDRVKTKMVRASGYLAKPFTKPDLLKVIFQHLH